MLRDIHHAPAKKPTITGHQFSNVSLKVSIALLLYDNLILAVFVGGINPPDNKAETDSSTDELQPDGRAAHPDGGG